MDIYKRSSIVNIKVNSEIKPIGIKQRKLSNQAGRKLDTVKYLAF